jgi:hypothetical protein
MDMMPEIDLFYITLQFELAKVVDCQHLLLLNELCFPVAKCHVGDMVKL